MPLVTESKSEGYYSYRNRWKCKAWTYTDWAVFNYTSYMRQYNNTQSRVKPDPLTDTALPKQYTQRIKPSVATYQQIGYNRDYACPGVVYAPIDGMTKGIAETTPTFPAYTLDWQTPVLNEIADLYVNIGSSLAEYRATANQFHAYGVGIANAWRRWKGLKKGRAKLTPCDIPAAELAYSFGVAPLVEDTFSVVEALRLRLEEPISVPFFKTVTAHVKSSTSKSGYTNYTRKLQVSNRVEGRVELEPFSHSIIFGNPSNWAWELIPFSFVVDWGIPIGNWLENIDIIRRINSTGGTRTIKENYVSFWKRVNTMSGVPVTGGWGKLSYKSHERKLLTSIPVPPFPRWKPSLSWHKVYRAMTLLIAVNQPCKNYHHIRRAHASRSKYTD